MTILPTIDPDERNLVVLDDQMSDAGKLYETSKLMGPTIETVPLYISSKMFFITGSA